MKKFISLTIASMIAVAALGTLTSADARNKLQDFLGTQASAKKFYKMTCLTKSYCGNWNLTN